MEALDANISVLLPFDMSRREQRAMARPWTLPMWGVAEGVPSLLSLSLAAWTKHSALEACVALAKPGAHPAAQPVIAVEESECDS